MYAYLEENECPVALLPVRAGAYKLYDPVRRRYPLRTLKKRVNCQTTSLEVQCELQYLLF
ncbi:hypothetical protein [Paradesulfitobacterium ferrireducens]|uniref:hypothetical protein n=1 Tax=Paradesulfitobacterium ferrireducens TaxID=2816476 RepID=UPI001A8D3804|nr:hypothetical protein [Paradesulfitobacterium ferrireducens]